jgi:TolB-like protein
MAAPVLYRFDDFLLDLDRRELRRGDGLIALEPQVFDLLAYLIRTRDRVVSRDDILAEVWSGRIVSEATLASRISAARSAIGDSGETQRLIRTIPRKGIRFVGEVREQAATVRTPVAAAPAFDGPAIAVLPFTNIGGDPEQEYFADGIVEDIITALSRCSGLAVIARNSSFIYKGKAVDIREVGRELGAGYVLEGSVRRAGSRLRITGQLIEASSGVHLWAERFDGQIDDVFALQDRISESIVAAIEPTLELAEGERRRAMRPLHPDAYDLLLRAASLRDAFTPDSLAAAITCLDQALAIDPACAPAMAARAYCQALRHFQGWRTPDEDYQASAVALAWRASECAINSNSAMALTLSGWIEIMAGETAAGRALIERAQRLNPRDPRGWFAAAAMAIHAVAEDDFAAAIQWAETALAQNRRFAVALRVLIVALVRSGHLARATSVARQLLEIEPDLTVSEFLARIPFPVRKMAATYAEALQAAGVPA